jgi:hypothetical protein
MLVLTSVILGENLKLCVLTDKDPPPYSKLRNLVKIGEPILQAYHDPDAWLVQEITKIFGKYLLATRAVLYSFSVLL